MKTLLLASVWWFLFAACLTAMSPLSSEVLVDAPLSRTEEQLGERLFNDPILSADSTVSCASCHKADFAFADNIAFSMGVNSIPTGRNTPSAMYMAKRLHFFWDARAATLEQQASGPITAPGEMNMPLNKAIGRLQASPYYREAFQNVYNALPDSAYLVMAIARFERTLEKYDSPYDRFLKGDDEAMSESAIRGFNLFFKQSTCSAPACHSGDDFSSDSLVNINVNEKNDVGRFKITNDSSDIGKFKVPHLRNVAVTAPYMHDGSVKTLREVVVFYNTMTNFPLNGHSHQSVKHQRPRPLTENEINDLVEFMKALTDSRYLHRIK